MKSQLARATHLRPVSTAGGKKCRFPRFGRTCSSRGVPISTSRRLNNSCFPVVSDKPALPHICQGPTKHPCFAGPILQHSCLASLARKGWKGFDRRPARSSADHGRRLGTELAPMRRPLLSLRYSLPHCSAPLCRAARLRCPRCCLPPWRFPPTRARSRWKKPSTGPCTTAKSLTWLCSICSPRNSPPKRRVPITFRRSSAAPLYFHFDRPLGSVLTTRGGLNVPVNVVLQNDALTTLSVAQPLTALLKVKAGVQIGKADDAIAQSQNRAGRCGPLSSAPSSFIGDCWLPARSLPAQVPLCREPRWPPRLGIRTR